MTNTKHPARRFARYVIKQAERLQPELLQHPNRGCVIRSHQPEHRGKIQGFERQHQRITPQFGGVALPPGLDGKTITEVDAPLGQVMERRYTAKANQVVRCFDARNRPPAVPLGGPLLQPVVE